MMADADFQNFLERIASLKVLGCGLLSQLSFIYSLLLKVFSPKGIYNGHIATTLVSMNIPEKMSNIMAQVPDKIPAKYNTAMVTAISILITLSAIPMFFFIIFVVLRLIIYFV